MTTFDPGDDPPKNATGPSAETPEPILTNIIGRQLTALARLRLERLQWLRTLALDDLRDRRRGLVESASCTLQALARRGAA